MSAGDAEWVWENSRAANGSLIVLLAIADECRRGSEVEMSVTQIARKARLGDRATRGAIKDLERLGELSVTPRQGGVSRYGLPATPAVSAGPPLSAPVDTAGPPRQILPDRSGSTPADTAGPVDATPADTAGVKRDASQVSEGTPADTAGPEPVDNFSDDLKGSVVSGRRSRSKSSSEPLRDDAERLCQHLAERMVANGCKRPAITQKWRDAARLLIDADGRTEAQVHACIDWSQKDEFWHRNIHSMPTLRAQYDKLRLAALAEQKQKSRPNGTRGNPDDDYAEAMQRIRARKESANGAGGNGHDSAPSQVCLPSAAD